MNEAIGYFPMTRLPGVVRQNMADFHSNPLGWNTVQLSPRVYSGGGKITQTRRIKRSSSTRALGGGLSQLVLFCLKKSDRGCGAGRDGTSPRAAAAASPLPIFSSVLFTYFYYKAVHSSTGWVTSASHPLTGEGGVSRQTNAT